MPSGTFSLHNKKQCSVSIRDGIVLCSQNRKFLVHIPLPLVELRHIITGLLVTYEPELKLHKD